MKKAIVFITGIFAAVYLLALVGLYTLQRSVLYIPPPVYLMPADVGLEPAIEVDDPKKSGNIIGWWLPPNDKSAPTVMFFHGNGSAVYSGHDIYRMIHAQGYGVFALAYPGYPGRSGETTQDTLTQAAKDGYDFIRAQGVDADKVVYYGTSLGAGIAAQLSRERSPALIIMEAPFTSAADMAQLRFPIFPAAALTKDRFDSVGALAGLGIPLIWLHGTGDKVIPFSMRQNLYERYDGPKTAYKITAGGHNNLWHRAGRDIILSELAALESAP